MGGAFARLEMPCYSGPSTPPTYCSKSTEKGSRNSGPVADARLLGLHWRPTGSPGWQRGRLTLEERRRRGGRPFSRHCYKLPCTYSRVSAQGGIQRLPCPQVAKLRAARISNLGLRACAEPRTRPLPPSSPASLCPNRARTHTYTDRGCSLNPPPLPPSLPGCLLPRFRAALSWLGEAVPTPLPRRRLLPARAVPLPRASPPSAALGTQDGRRVSLGLRCRLASGARAPPLVGPGESRAPPRGFGRPRRRGGGGGGR